MLTLLAAIDGSNLVQLLVTVVITGLICWILWWFLGVCGLPEPFNKIGRILIALVAVIVLIGVLLNFSGVKLINW